MRLWRSSVPSPAGATGYACLLACWAGCFWCWWQPALDPAARLHTRPSPPTHPRSAGLTTSYSSPSWPPLRSGCLRWPQLVAVAAAPSARQAAAPAAMTARTAAIATALGRTARTAGALRRSAAASARALPRQRRRQRWQLCCRTRRQEPSGQAMQQRQGSRPGAHAGGHPETL